jgi:hypothetical protein
MAEMLKKVFETPPTIRYINKNTALAGGLA